MEGEEFKGLDRLSKNLELGAGEASSRRARGFTQPFQALEFHEFGGGGPQVVAVEKRLERTGRFCGPPVRAPCGRAASVRSRAGDAASNKAATPITGMLCSDIVLRL